MLVTVNVLIFSFFNVIVSLTVATESSTSPKSNAIGSSEASGTNEGTLTSTSSIAK